MMYEITIPTFTKTLKNLDSILEKASAFADQKKFDSKVLLQSRLAPDMLPLVRQIQIACDTAKLGASRLTGKDAPVHDDKEETLAEIRNRIKDTVKYLETLTSKDFTDAESRKVTQARWEGKYLTGQDYALEHAIPNIYFHVTTAYAILRHNGVDIGKKDYLGALPYKQ